MSDQGFSLRFHVIGLKSTVLNYLLHFDGKECIGALRFTLLKCAVEEIKTGLESDVMMWTRKKKGGAELPVSVSVGWVVQVVTNFYSCDLDFEVMWIWSVSTLLTCELIRTLKPWPENSGTSFLLPDWRKKNQKTKHMKSSTCNLLSIFFKCRMKQEGGMFLLLLFAFFYLSFLKLYVIVQVKLSWFIWIAGSLLWVSEIQWDHDLLAIKEAVCLVLVLLAQSVLIDCTGN